MDVDLFFPNIQTGIEAGIEGKRLGLEPGGFSETVREAKGQSVFRGGL